MLAVNYLQRCPLKEDDWPSSWLGVEGTVWMDVLLMQEAAISLDGPALGTMHLADFSLFLIINNVLQVLSFSPQPSLNKWKTSVCNSFPFNK